MKWTITWSETKKGRLVVYVEEHDWIGAVIGRIDDLLANDDVTSVQIFKEV